MSVVVFGMEMPEHCGECGIEFCVKWINHDATTRPKDCPLRPLPEKHGRLIDESILRETFGIGEKCEECKQDTRECRFTRSFTRMDFCGWIDDMETIVEAEGD